MLYLEGQCGYGGQESQFLPVLVPLGEPVAKIYCGGFHTIALYFLC